MGQERKIAVARLHLADGTILNRRVLLLDGDRLVRHFPLTEELPFVEWRGGDYYEIPPIE